jgi:hypothetical protein
VNVSGRLGIGTTTPNFPLEVATTANLSTSASYGYLNNFGASTFPGGPINIPVSIMTTGRIVTNAEVDAFSDSRKKDVVGAVDPALAAWLVRQLRPMKFTWKDGPDRSLKVGFIAQEVDEVVPEAVTKIKAQGYDDLHVLNYDALFTLNVGATQSALGATDALAARVEQLSAENAALHERLVRLEAKMTALEGARCADLAPGSAATRGR